MLIFNFRNKICERGTLELINQLAFVEFDFLSSPNFISIYLEYLCLQINQNNNLIVDKVLAVLDYILEYSIHGKYLELYNLESFGKEFYQILVYIEKNPQFNRSNMIDIK